MPETFYWHDYETWGTDPRRDRPCQFAGLRTDADFNELGAAEPPLMCFCRPPADQLPSPDACLVTGLTPQRTAREGLSEAEFARTIHRELARPGTCSVGYNNLRFDEDVSRFLFYRTFRDPYAHAYGEGRSRWDLIDVLRLAHALRPEGITWPCHPSGEPSFKLQHLTAANGIDHQGAHDALADVRATLALARRLRALQPRLFAYALEMRKKNAVRERADCGKPVLHVSSKYPAKRGCIAPVMVVAPEDRNAMFVWDLREDPEELFELPVERMRERLFTRAEDRSAGMTRLPVKRLRLNMAPMVAPLATLRPEQAERWAIDIPTAQARWTAFQAHPRAQLEQVAARLHTAFSHPKSHGTEDPEDALYAGFIPDADRPLMAKVLTMSPQELAQARLPFQDTRLPVLLFRYRARNWPDSLNPQEREQWQNWCRQRLNQVATQGGFGLRDYHQRIEELRAEHAADARLQQLLQMLAAWPDELAAITGETR